jgi:hypothetical protein
MGMQRIYSNPDPQERERENLNKIGLSVSDKYSIIYSNPVNETVKS